MNKTYLVTRISDRGGFTKEEVRCILDMTGEFIMEAVAAGETVSLSGFGTFERRYHKPRVGRNPQTGESIEIAGKYAPAFKPAKGFKDTVSSAG